MLVLLKGGSGGDIRRGLLVEVVKVFFRLHYYFIKLVLKARNCFEMVPKFFVMASAWAILVDEFTERF